MCTSLRMVCCVGLVLAAVSGRGPGQVAAADSVTLSESPTDQRAYKVTVKMDLTGTLETETADGKTRPTPLTTTASTTYEERRLPGTGREAEAYRSIRTYDNPRAHIKTGDYEVLKTLRQSRRLIVSEGRREGLRQFSPAGPLTYDEVDLLQFPGDSLMLLTLLHDAPLEAGEVWKPSDWVLQAFTGIEASDKTAINCKLESVSKGVARVEFSGEIRGADLGARCVIRVTGHYLYDLEKKYLKSAEITQEDQREAGVLHPAFNVQAKVKVTREPLEKPVTLTDEVLKTQPLESSAAALLLIYEQPEWGIRFYHDRQWHIFHQNPNAAVLRMMQQGTAVAQFMVSPAAAAKPGEHASPETFKADIQKSLKTSFQEFALAEEVKTGTGLYHYRAIAVGGVEREVPRMPDAKAESKTTETKTEDKAGDKTKPVSSTTEPETEKKFIPFQWMFNLLAAPDGRQMVLTFIVESDMIQKFQAQDATILGNFQFLPKGK